MEIKQIEYVAAIAESKSISKAAEKLSISQPALSQQLQRLEEKYGVQLFQRSSRSLRLTPAGELFLEKGLRILELQRQTDRELMEFSDNSRGSFSVGISHGRCASIVANIIPLFRQRFPQYKVRIFEARSFREASNMLLQNELDLAFNAFPDNEPEAKTPFRMCTLCHEELLLAISKDHPLAALSYGLPEDVIPTADLKKFDGYDFALPPRPAVIRQIAEQAFLAAGISPEIVCEIHDQNPIYRIVTNSNLCTIIPSNYIAPAKRQIHFHLDPPRFWDFAICWTPTHFVSQAEQYFIDLCYANQQEWANNK